METIADIATGYFFNPESRVKLPVPPPIVTIRFIFIPLSEEYRI
jgi:hypothetical protein